MLCCQTGSTVCWAPVFQPLCCAAGSRLCAVSLKQQSGWGDMTVTARLAGRSGCRWAYAKLGVMPPEDFMVAAAQQMQSDLSRTVPQDLSNSLWMSALPPAGVGPV